MKEYYDSRAQEYDDFYLGTGLFAERDRPGWHAALKSLTRTLTRLRVARTLDVACGTGFLTRHLPGELTGLDQSARMLAIAGERVASGTFLQGDALALPFDDRSFDRVITGHFYGHLEERDRRRFLSEARRVATELIVIDSARRPDRPAEEWQERVLRDGSRYRVFKRYFDARGLSDELGNGEVLHASPWFVVVRSLA